MAVEVLVVEEDLALDPAAGVTSCIRLSVRRNVDLPQPEGPMNAVTERGSTVIEMSSIALWEP